MPETRVCKRCGAIKPETDFDFKVGRRGARELWCYDCVVEFRAESLSWMKEGREEDRVRAGRNIVASSAVKSTAQRLVDDPKRAVAIIKMYARKEALRVRGSPKQYKCARCDRTASQFHHISYDEEWWTKVVPVCARCHKLHHNGALKPLLSEKDIPKWR